MTVRSGFRVEKTGRGERSQALLGQRGAHLVGQGGELRWVGHVDAARGGNSAEPLRRLIQRDDLRSVVSPRLRLLAEHQLVRLNLRRAKIILMHSYAQCVHCGVTFLRLFPKSLLCLSCCSLFNPSALCLLVFTAEKLFYICLASLAS